MSYLGVEAPEVSPEIDDAPFWDAASRRKLVIQACAECGTACHPPKPLCPNCQSFDKVWHSLPEEGKVFSFTWSHVASTGIDKSRLPYNIVLITPKGLKDVRLISNVVDATPETLQIGRLVKVVWEQDSGGQFLARFKLAEDLQPPAGSSGAST